MLSKQLHGTAARNCKCLNKYLGIHNLTNCKLSVGITKECNVSRNHVIDNGANITTSNRCLVLNDHVVLPIVSPMNDDTSRDNVIPLREDTSRNNCTDTSNDNATPTMGAILRNIGMSMRGHSSINDVTPTRMDISNGDASPMRNYNGTSMMEYTSGNYGTTDTNISRNFISLMIDDTLRNNGRHMRDDTSRISPTHKNKTVNHSNTFTLCVGNVQSAGNKIYTIT